MKSTRLPLLLHVLMSRMLPTKTLARHITNLIQHPLCPILACRQLEGRQTLYIVSDLRDLALDIAASVFAVDVMRAQSVLSGSKRPLRIVRRSFELNVVGHLGGEEEVGETCTVPDDS